MSRQNLEETLRRRYFDEALGYRLRIANSRKVVSNDAYSKVDLLRMFIDVLYPQREAEVKTSRVEEALSLNNQEGVRETLADDIALARALRCIRRDFHFYAPPFNIQDGLLEYRKTKSHVQYPYVAVRRISYAWGVFVGKGPGYATIRESFPFVKMRGL